MKLIDPFHQLDAYHFWRVQTHNAPSGRRYEVRVNHDHHYYEASGRSVGSAVAIVLEKIKAGFQKSRNHRRQNNAPKLKLTSDNDDHGWPMLEHD